jgi:hypothetical protein
MMIPDRFAQQAYKGAEVTVCDSNINCGGDLSFWLL